MLAGTCQNDSEYDCANSCPVLAADTLDDLNEDDLDDHGSRKLLSLADDTQAGSALLWHIHSTLSARSPATELLLGPIDSVNSISSVQGVSGTVQHWSSCRDSMQDISLGSSVSMHSLYRIHT